MPLEREKLTFPWATLSTKGWEAMLWTPEPASASPVLQPRAAKKVVDWDDLLELRQCWRRDGKIVVWTNGCFDFLHLGHVRTLQAAKALGDILVVGVNSDESVRELKGPGRPVFPACERVEMLAALECVDCVVVFQELTPENAVARLQPDIHCKGADYAPPNGKPIPEAKVVEGYGGRVAFLPLLPGHSSSAFIRRIRQMDGDANRSDG